MKLILENYEFSKQDARYQFLLYILPEFLIGEDCFTLLLNFDNNTFTLETPEGCAVTICETLQAEIDTFMNDTAMNDRAFESYDL
jgi:hypothetical protein